MGTAQAMAELHHWWLPLAAAGEPAAGQCRAVRHFDAELVSWRGAAGVAAFDGRCPHRGASLALGRVSGDTLECACNGWRFAADGACLAVAGAAGLPAAGRPCREGRWPAHNRLTPKPRRAISQAASMSRPVHARIDLPIPIRRAALLVGAAVLVLPAAAVAASAAELGVGSKAALQQLIAGVPAAKALAKDAKAVLVFPKVAKAGLGIGGQYGEGALTQGGKVVLMAGLGVQGNKITKINPKQGR
jgi:nitrite reductase/ring-hydroxylating ferredoxin subunit